MMTSLLKRWNALEVAQLRARRLPGFLVPYVPVGGQVLDVGSGDGHIASCMGTDGGAASVQGVDVLLRTDPLIPTTSFDGENLPHDDDAFDLVTLIDVLHHTHHPERLLSEALRVSRGPVLIKDHDWVTAPDRWILTLSDYLGNAGYGVSLPYNFLRMEEWTALFDRLDLAVIATERFRYAPYDFSRQVIFMVAPASGGTTNWIDTSAKSKRAGKAAMTSPSTCTGSP